MRLLTPEQQAAVPADQPIGTLAEQGLAHDNNGTTYVTGTIAAFIDPAQVSDWRHAVALGLVSRSRFAEWKPFVKSSGTERTYACGEGRAWATDGVHILIETAGRGDTGVQYRRWISRSAQVVTLKLPPITPGGALVEVNAAKHLRIVKPKTVQPARSLASDYDSL